MRGRVRTVWLAAGVACVAAFTAGCEGVYPQPSEDAVIQFLKNARLGGKLRVCWPAGQEYVLGIMKADAELRTALDAQLAPIATTGLWPADDPQWQKEYAPKNDEKPAEDPKEPPAPSLDALSKAIDKLPEGLKLDTPEAQDALKAKVWSALAVDGTPLPQYVEQVTSLGTLIRRFTARVTACNGSFDKAALGLRFTDETCQRDVDALYAELDAAWIARSERFLQYAAEQMDHVRSHIKELNKQTQRDEYLLLDNTRDYFKRTLRDGWLKHLDDQIRKMQHELDEHNAGKKVLEGLQLEFVKKELPRLKAQHEALKERVDVIVPDMHKGN